MATSSSRLFGRGGRAIALVVLALIVAAPATSGRTTSFPRLHVAPNGSVSSSCTAAAPCRSLDRANHLARAGQIVELAGGAYPAQDLTAVPERSGRHAVFQPAQGADVRFTGRLTLDRANTLTLRRLRLRSDPANIDDRALFIDACTHDIRLERVSGDTFFIAEGTRGVVFTGGSWGGYSTPGKEDSAIGTSGATGPTRRCDGKLAPPARNIVFHGVTFHDVFWGKTTSEWGDSHPDCFEINGYVDGVRIENSRFLRCASTFMQINGDQGDIVNVSFVRNLYYRLGPESWYGIQMTSEGKPGKCGGVVFRRNTYLPATKNPQTWPNAPIRTDCEAVAGTKPVLISRNVFARGPNQYDCANYSSPRLTTWSDNFMLGGRCGSGPLGVPYGYTSVDTGLRLVPARAARARFIFRAAAQGRNLSWILSRLGADWNESRVRAVLKNAAYAGAYGAPGADPAIVSVRMWRAAQRFLRS